jgi:hypothetical protein
MSEQTSEHLLLFRGHHWDEGLSPEQLEQAMATVTAWFDGLREQGKVKAGQPLGAQGRIISASKGRVADGPFVESKEAVGGYLILQNTDLDQATAIARSCPTVEWGITIEVRPLLDECPIFKRAKERLFLANATT